jgi:aminoglycoside phosphotransferase (APT) family kinase protein
VLGHDLIVALAELHSVDPTPLVADRLGRTGGYVARQIARWSSQRDGVRAYAQAMGLQARELPDHDWLVVWLQDNLPPDDQAPAVVHGDFKLDNVLVDPATSTVTAILDWEMGTVGDPLADLGYLLAMSTRPGEDSVFAQLAGTVTAEAGFPSHEDWIATYAGLTGRDVSRLPYYSVLAGWKMAILLEMSYHRFLAGLADDPLFPHLEWGVPALLRRARSLADTSLEH